MTFDFLTKPGPLDCFDFETCENLALAGDTLLHQIAARLLVELRQVRHDLDDPSYMYGGSRIHRHAIVSRNATIEKLQKDTEALRKSKVFFFQDRTTRQIVGMIAETREEAKKQFLLLNPKYDYLDNAPTACCKFATGGFVLFAQEDCR